MWLGNEQFSQYCEDNSIFTEVDIPLEDAYAFEAYTDYNWVYDKRKIYDYQNIRYFPHGKAKPDFLPCFSKPFENLWGMGIDTCVCEDVDDYNKSYKPAHICMELLHGEHSCIDVITEDCKIHDWKFTVGHYLERGKFSYWEAKRFQGNHDLDMSLINRRRFVLTFIEDKLSRFKGAVNFEFIGDKCIEVHLRPNVEMSFAWGLDYIKQLSFFYQPGGTWRPQKDTPENSYVFPVWGKTNKRYSMKQSVRDQFSVAEGVNFVYYDIIDKQNANPPGGQRLAFVAGNNYGQCKDHAEKLSNYFNG